MECVRCGSTSILLAHDVEELAHNWPTGREADCSCDPVPVCSACEAARLRAEGFLLLPRHAGEVRGVAPAGEMRH
jgi:hypothetical protein